MENGGQLAFGVSENAQNVDVVYMEAEQQRH